MLRASWKGQTVEVCVRDAQILSLPTLVRAHSYIAVGTTCEPPVCECLSAKEARLGKDGESYGLTPVQKAVRPSSQFRHRPSATLKGITTRSPFLSRETAEPVSRTIPIFSCPVFVFSSLTIETENGEEAYRSTILLEPLSDPGTCANLTRRLRQL